MPKIDPFAIQSNYGKLKSVFALQENFDSENILTGIKLEFENGTIYHEAIADDDSISSTQEVSWPDKNLKDVSNVIPWGKVIGKRPMWFWNLKQDETHCDAVQYMFGNSFEDETHTIQLMVTASEIQIYEVKRTL